MQFLCDHMLVRLGRWLRAAGYDTLIAEPTDEDRDLLSKAQEEGRLLITRDKGMLELPGAKERILCLENNSTDECARELSEKVSVNWLKARFSRCLLCNEPLTSLHSEEVKGVISEASEFWRCTHCQKTYWEGSHTERMLKQLKTWNQIR